MMSPTPQQLAALRFISGFQAHHGYCPSFVEVMRGVGLHSKSGVARLLNGLEERGLIRRPAQTARAIEILVELPIPRAPDGAPLRSVVFQEKADA